MKIERELKYSTTEEHVPSLAELRQMLGSSELELRSMSIRRHIDNYYDDAAGSLKRAGWALRKRHSGGVSSDWAHGGSEATTDLGTARAAAARTVATLKGAARLDGALHSRQELEVEVKQDGTGLENGWPAAIVAALPPATDLQQLRELVDLRVRRAVVPIARSGVTVAELSFDEVVCSVPESADASAAQAFDSGPTLDGTPHFTFHEVEIEALDESGEAAILETLEEVAAAVMELLPLTRSSTSKLERATTLLGPFIEDKFGSP